MAEYPLLGEIAALVTAVSFAFTSTIFTFAGRLVGSEVVNRSRLLIAFLLLAAVHQGLFGLPAPFRAESERWFWLGMSGVIGLALGDAFLFQAFLLIGPRLGMLLMSLAPVIAAVLGFLFLGEGLEPVQVLGVLLTMGGVAWVVLERRAGGTPPTPSLNPEARPVRRFTLQKAVRDNRVFAMGILLGVLAAAGQAIGMVLAKLGLYGDFPPISGNVIRLSAATASIWVYYLLRGKAFETYLKVRAHPRSAWLLLAGALTGPVIGVSFSLLAVQRTAVGIASTLIATTPVFMLPIGRFVFRERVSRRAISGTLVTIVGIGLLFLS